MNELILHDYLRDTPVSTYKECIFCKSRTQFTCIKCGYCYSCHWKKEELDRVRLETAVTANSAISENATTSTIVEQLPPPTPYLLQQQEKAIDVYGQETEPICSYRRCHHKFSEHLNHNCKCHHAVNYATGVSISRLCKIEVL